ncbi:MAG TPA: alpha/beta hydrolase [Candidatus Acidoferrales bacterium]|nr:alpha/beta hydrolase [Candidatus Acidoferrales bacterium]
MRYVAVLLALVLISASGRSPDLSGTWQGTMDVPGIGKLPRVMRITKAGSGYDVKIYSAQESEVPIATRNVKIDGSTITMAFDMNSDPWLNYHRTYHAKLSSDGKTLSGTWGIAGRLEIPMVYHRTPPVALHMLQPARDLYVEVGSGVKDEVLDWGGSGRPMVLLAGQGVTARGWRALVPDLVKKYHVYSITRRGYGNSSKPPTTVQNFSAERLGQDVLAILDKLQIEKPILVGHSLAGEELSYIGTKAPQKAAALIYLDAAYDAAYDAGIPTPPPPSPPPGSPPEPPIDVAIDAGSGHFTTPIDLPILAIFANPHDDKPGPGEPATFVAALNAFTTKQIEAFKKGQPKAQVIVIPNANHFVFISNKDEVLRDINAFVATLPA